MTERLLTPISTKELERRWAAVRVEMGAYQTASLFAVICDDYLVGRDGPSECLHRTEKKVFEV